MICDPILCQPLNCTRQVHPEELCCPICEGTWRLRGPQAGVWGAGVFPMGTRWGGPSLSLCCWHCVHALITSLFLAEKKMGQEELRLERARDSSEGESQQAQAEGATLPLWLPGTPTGAVPTSLSPSSPRLLL